MSPALIPLDWTPPDGMLPAVVQEWRSFYRAAQRAYGITPKDYRDMYVAQHGVCFICRTAKGKNPDDPKGRGGRRLAVDHNHALGGTRRAVRGLLCSGGDKTCNRILGWLTHAQLVRAADYLEKPPAQRVFAPLDLLGAGFEGQLVPLSYQRDFLLAGILGLDRQS